MDEEQHGPYEGEEIERKPRERERGEHQQRYEERAPQRSPELAPGLGLRSTLGLRHGQTVTRAGVRNCSTLHRTTSSARIRRLVGGATPAREAGLLVAGEARRPAVGVEIVDDDAIDGLELVSRT